MAPVCEVITRAILLPSAHHQSSSNSHTQYFESDQHQSVLAPTEQIHNHHDANHQCQYYTVYGNLVLPPELDTKEILVRIQIRLLAFQQRLSHVWSVLQRLYLLPRGRAPPIYA